MTKHSDEPTATGKFDFVEKNTSKLKNLKDLN